MAVLFLLGANACTYTEATPGAPERPNTGITREADTESEDEGAIAFSVDGAAGEMRFVANTDSGLNIRTGPGTTNESQGRLPAGTQVTLTGETADVDGDRWVEVTSGYLQGWVHSGYLISAEDFEEIAVTTPRLITTWPAGTILTVATNPGANLRDAPAGEIVLGLTQGTEVEATGPEDNGWIPVKAGTLEGWVFAELLERVSTAEGTAATGSIANVTPGQGLSGVNVRSAPNGTILTGIPAGEVAELTGTVAGDWSELTYRNVTGWSLTDLLVATDDPLTVVGSTATINKPGDVVAVHAEPSQESAAITSLADRTTVTLTGAGSASGWSEIVLPDGTRGWVPSTYLLG